jgi:Glycosyltransferase family 87
MQASKLKFAVFLYLSGMVAIHAVVFWQLRDSVRKGYSDFAIYYCAGTIVRRGFGRQLYDQTMQFKVQREFSPDVAIRLDALPYNHPAFEATLFTPFTYVSYPVAFALWTLANLAMLICLPFMLRPYLHNLQGYPVAFLVVASLDFFPIFFSLLQGQDAILLLFLYTLGFICLKRNRDVAAGAWLALGLFKPHLILPFIILLLVQGKKKVLYGFFPIAAALALASVFIVGSEAMLQYPRYVLHLEDTMAQGAIMPSAMPNLRGIFYLLLHGDSAVLVIASVSSVGLLLFAALRCRAGANLVDLKFSLIAVATVLVSYHALGYDLSMLMLPIFLLTNEFLGKGRVRRWNDFLTIAAIAVLFFSPLQLLLLTRSSRYALIGWILLLWMFGIGGEISSQMKETCGLQNAEVGG